MLNSSAIKKCMNVFVESTRDSNTGEVNYTMLAEIACNELDLFEGPEYNIPEVFFELALEFS